MRFLSSAIKIIVITATTIVQFVELNISILVSDCKQMVKFVSFEQALLTEYFVFKCRALNERGTINDDFLNSVFAYLKTLSK